MTKCKVNRKDGVVGVVYLQFAHEHKTVVRYDDVSPRAYMGMRRLFIQKERFPDGKFPDRLQLIIRAPGDGDPLKRWKAS